MRRAAVVLVLLWSSVGRAGSDDWRRLECLGERDAGVWRELAQAQRRYQGGVTSNIEVVDAQTRTERARDNRIMDTNIVGNLLNFSRTGNIVESAEIDRHRHTVVVDGFSPEAIAGMTTVADTGEGIPPDLLPRIFEPQFSTRSSGTGLGLAIVKRLVESWGGEVTVDSTPGEGTTVHLRLRVAGEGVKG